MGTFPPGKICKIEASHSPALEEFGISESAGNGLVSTAADSNEFYYLTMFERKMLKTRRVIL